MTNYKLTYAVPGRCEFDIASPASAYRDRTGHLSLWGISKFEQDTATICGNHGFMQSIRDMASKNNIRFFHISEKRIMSPTCHSKLSWSGVKQVHVRFNVSCITPGSVGNKRVFSDTESGDWYMKSENRLVAVNWDNRRPVKFPKSYYESASELVDKEEEILITRRQDALIPPDRAFKTTIKTRYSDLDYNDHPNTAQYYQFCCDAASKASRSGYYRHYTSDIVNYPVMETEATFLGGCGPEEQLDIYTWQDECDITKLYFAIYLKEARIFQACFVLDSKLSQDKVLSSL
ncbi:uncharacterized protein LOC132554651 isoform X1 [Ylistrum balloti]|uniref:uncharacterized protein LOC132554651 isoform X1 n=1 Tax=Ylistrum balloti TaxID=509963 RepID=UPI002905B374|nr:uncharacterized protein LOC132554651 isoform X1 [Ylistrum balloti]